MELKKWMMVEHILFKTCNVLDIDFWMVIFTSTARKWTIKIKYDKFSPYVNPILDREWKQTYSIH